MPSFIEKVLSSDPLPFGKLYRYTMLGVGLGLLGLNITWLAELRPGYPYEGYGGTIVILMLLLNHLAFAFHWPRRVTMLLRVAAFLWMGVAMFYVFYLSHVWFPLPAK